MLLSPTMVKRSMVCSASPRYGISRVNDVNSVKFVVSTISVLPSLWPMESPMGSRVVAVFGKDHQFFRGLDERIRPAIQEKAWQRATRVELDIPQRRRRHGLQQKVTSLAVFLGYPRQHFIGRVHRAH